MSEARKSLGIENLYRETLTNIYKEDTLKFQTGKGVCQGHLPKLFRTVLEHIFRKPTWNQEVLLMNSEYIDLVTSPLEELHLLIYELNE